MECHGTVLIVDDDGGIRESIAALLEDEGYHPVCAENGRAALDWLRSHGEPPCLIFLDLMMPVMDGWRFGEELGRDDTLCGIPVIIMTAGIEAKKPAVAAELLHKPVRLDALLAAAEHYC